MAHTVRATATNTQIVPTSEIVFVKAIVCEVPTNSFNAASVYGGTSATSANLKWAGFGATKSDYGIEYDPPLRISGGVFVTITNVPAIALVMA